MTLSTLQEDLADLRDKSLLRSLRTLEPVDSVHARLNGREVTLFCGNDYLGLTHHPETVRAARKALEKYGTGAGAARLISGSFGVHEALEREIARIKRKPKALVFSAGYLANLGTIAALAGEGDLVVLDKRCHASLIDAARLSGAELRVFPHKNYEKCEAILKRDGRAGKKLLITDSVFSMDGDLADLVALADLRDRYQSMLIVDDAHGTGVLGEKGWGALEDFPRMDSVDVVTGTLSKALGGLGGFAAASETVIDYLINKARPFIFATALPPACCASALKAIELLKTEPALRTKLWKNAETLHAGIQKAGFNLSPLTSPILPVILGEEQRAVEVSQGLLDRGLLVPAVRYPTVAKGKARLRVTACAVHDDASCDLLISSLSSLS
ncbi:MAG: 8-amino-7-oxononanoate synthase [Candidatus Omnitrophota bacterium]